MSSLSNQSILAQTQLEARTVGQRMWLRPSSPKQGSGRENAQLTLTSLVDCFTILVAYLLVATTMGGMDVDTERGIQLPTASHSSMPNFTTVVTVNKGIYKLDSRPTRPSDLLVQLKDRAEIAQGKSLLVQADRTTDFNTLNPIVLAGLQAGYQKIGFAVLQEDK
jgi:biopolymer transport protein ExbD